MGMFLVGLFLGWSLDSARETFALVLIVVALFMAFAVISILMALLLEGLLRGVMALTPSERTRKRLVARFVNDSQLQRVSDAARLYRPLRGRPRHPA